jgi:hypothetical protein
MVLDRRTLIPPSRALPSDIASIGRRIPIARAELIVDLSLLSNSRSLASPRISWAAVFARAYGLVTDEVPCLRQTYMAWPFPHIYQHAQSTAMIAIQRDESPSPRLCFGRIVNPGGQSLTAVQSVLDRYQREPVAKTFRKQVLFSRMPSPLRRLIWWLVMNVSGRRRSRQLGTFSISSLAGQGVFNRDHPTVCTSGLSYGPLGPRGECLLTLAYDHRLMDGMQAARALHRLRDHLQHTMVDELKALHRRAA